MDNLTHSIVGLAVGEFVHQLLPPQADLTKMKTRRRLLLTTGWAASNFPDLDLVLSPLLPSPLGYLLHHRGHTHTLIAFLPQVLLLFALMWFLWPQARRQLRLCATTRQGWMAAALVGFALHVGMDFLNSYGVHPFYPFNSNWFYGDSVFIIEPVFWMTLAIPLILLISKAWLRAAFGIALVAPLFLFVSQGYLHWASLVALLILGTFIARFNSLRIGFVVATCFVMMQLALSKMTRTAIEKSFSAADPTFELIDAATNSFPANPFCWMFTTVERQAKSDVYRLKRGVISLAPKLVAVSSCPASLSDFERQKAGTDEIALAFEKDASIKDLVALRDSNCQFAAWLRFARAPLLAEMRADDLRYGFGDAVNFTSINLANAQDQNCPANVPPWAFPRSDLLKINFQGRNDEDLN